MRTLERTAAIIAILLLVVFAGLVAFRLLRPAATSVLAQSGETMVMAWGASSSPPIAPASQFPYPARIFCPACAIDAVPIPIWKQPEAIVMACLLGSNDDRNATVIAEERSAKGALMVQVHSARCTGWLAETWVRRR